MDADSALQWAQSNQNDPRAKAVMAKAWAMQNPNDPRSGQIMQKIGQSVQQSQNPQQLPDAADKASQGNNPQAKSISLAPRGAAQQDISDLQQMPQGLKNGFAKAIIGVGTGGAGGMAAEGMGIGGTAAVNAGASGLQQYLGNVLDKNQDSTQGVGGAAILGGAGSAVLGGIGKAAGGAADRLQQWAMGMKTNVPGAGITAIDQGIRGGRSAMLGQVQNALSGLGDEAGEAIGKLGRIDSAQAAGPLQKYADSLKVGDIVPGHSASDMANAASRAGEVASRGEIDAQAAWELAQKAGQSGYRNQKALQNEGAYLAQLEQQGYSGAIKEAYQKANPGSSNEVADKFGQMSDLYKAQSALSKPETTRSGLPLTDLLSLATGAATHEPGLALGGIALNHLSKSPAVQSYGAKGLSLLGQGAETASDPALIQGLFGASKATQSN